MSTQTDHDPEKHQGENPGGKKNVGQGVSLPAYLTPSHVGSVTAGYPEAVRAGVRWLADYCRDKCQSDHRILAKHTQEAQCSRSFSYFYTLFRGIHEFSGEDSISKFLDLVLKMRTFAAGNDEDEEVIFGDFSLYEDFENLIFSRRKKHTRNRLVLQCGATGTGKSELQKQFIRRHGAKMSIARAEASARPSLWDWQALLRKSLGVSMGGRFDLRAEIILTNLKAFDIIFLDDCHRLYRETWGTNQGCWNFIQRMHDETKCVIVVSMTDVFADDILTIRYFDQFFGRAGGRGNLFRMPEFPEDDHVLAVAKAYGLLNARGSLEDLRPAAHGYERLRPLQDALAQARADAKDGKFDFETLREFLPSPAELVVQPAPPTTKKRR